MTKVIEQKGIHKQALGIYTSTIELGAGDMKMHIS